MMWLWWCEAVAEECPLAAFVLLIVMACMHQTPAKLAGIRGR
jgi:hypothetical protein